MDASKKGLHFQKKTTYSSKLPWMKVTEFCHKVKNILLKKLIPIYASGKYQSDKVLDLKSFHFSPLFH